MNDTNAMPKVRTGGKRIAANAASNLSTRAQRGLVESVGSERVQRAAELAQKAKKARLAAAAVMSGGTAAAALLAKDVAMKVLKKNKKKIAIVVSLLVVIYLVIQFTIAAFYAWLWENKEQLLKDIAGVSLELAAKCGTSEIGDRLNVSGDFDFQECVTSIGAEKLEERFKEFLDE